MSWRRLRTLMLREARASLRDPFTIVVLITVPLGALLAFGFVLSTEVRGLNLGVLDSANSSLSRRIIAELQANGTFIPRLYPHRDALDHAIVAGEVSAALVVPADFDRQWQRASIDGEPPQLQVVYDGAEAVLAGNAEAFLRSSIAATVAQVAVENGVPGVTGAMPRSRGIRVVTRAVYNPNLDGKPYMVSGTFGFVLSFLTVLITAVSIVNERLGGTFEQLQVTPATSLEILLGKLLPYGAVFALDVVLMVLVAGFVLHVWPVGSIVFFVLVSSFYVLVSLALGLIISATSQSAGEAVQKSVMFSIPLVQLSGFAFPLRNMPTIVQWVGEVFPATHYIRIARAIYLRGEGPVALAPEIGLLLLFGVLLIFRALRSIEARA